MRRVKTVLSQRNTNLKFRAEKHGYNYNYKQ